MSVRASQSHGLRAQHHLLRSCHQLPDLRKQRFGVRGGKRKDLSLQSQAWSVRHLHAGPSVRARARLFARRKGAIHERNVVDEAAGKQGVRFVKDL